MSSTEWRPFCPGEDELILLNFSHQFIQDVSIPIHHSSVKGKIMPNPTGVVQGRDEIDFFWR